MINQRRLFLIRKPKIFDLIIVLILLIYKFFLDLIYIKFVYPNYEYYHFNLNYDFDFMIISYFFVIVISCFVPNLLYRKKMTDITIVLLIIMYFIPYTTLLSFSTHEIKYGFFVLTYFLLLILFNKIIKWDKLKIKFSDRQISFNKLFVILIIGCGLIVILVSGIYAGFRISFNLSEYYEYRAAARENLMPEILRYLYNWSIIGIDIGLAYCLIYKKKTLAVFVLLANFLAFSYNGKKSVLFILIVIIYISLYFKDKYINKIPIAFLGLSFFAYIEIIYRGGDAFIAKHFIRRLLFIPPHMGTLYYDYFSVHELDYLRSSILRRFGFVSPYGNIPRFIGQVYFSKVGILDMNANTGLCGDAFSNFGFFSLLIAPLIIVLTFKIIEICSREVDYKIQIVSSILLAYSFVSGAYFTLLLTNGIIFLAILMWTLSSKIKN